MCFHRALQVIKKLMKTMYQFTHVHKLLVMGKTTLEINVL
jgi:hypothetical protein